MHLAISVKSWLVFALAAVLTVCAVTPGFAVPPQSPAAVETSPDKPFVVEYYYKVKWGHADEFITLFQEEPLSPSEETGRDGSHAKVSAVSPRYHTTEDGRWDYRVTIVFKNATVANDGFDEKALIKQMYPDQETYKKEEQRRFEILDAHWDLPIKDVELNAQ